MRRQMVPMLVLLLGTLVVLPAVMGRLLAGSHTQPTVPDGPDSLTVSVYFPETNEIEKLVLGEYLKGVVAAEMPAEFETEALKAQFIVARTYTVRRMQKFTSPGNGGCPLNPAADVCADHNTSQAYTSREALEEKLGRVAAGALWRRLDQSQAETEGLVLTYQGVLIDPLYHSVSGRMTEDAGEYFGRSLPYLKPVDDQWGASSPKLTETRRFSLESMAKALTGVGKAVPATSSVKIVARTTTGRVKSVNVGGVLLTGREFRERLGLRSTDFSVAMENGKIVVHTTGYGHGIGMSQYGANGMAKAGKGVAEILTHYYSGVRISRLFEE